MKCQRGYLFLALFAFFVALAFLLMILVARSAIAQQAQPVIPLIGGAVVSQGNPLPIAPASAAGGGTAGYPAGATPITGNSTGTTGAVVGTLAGVVAKFTYICGFNVSAIGGTAAVGPVTIAGLTGSSQVYQLASAAGGASIGFTFSPCIPASAVNTAITTTTTADGTATAVDVNSWGFQQ